MMSFRAHSDKHHNFSIERFATGSRNSFFSLNVDPFDFLFVKMEEFTKEKNRSSLITPVPQ